MVMGTLARFQAGRSPLLYISVLRHYYTRPTVEAKSEGRAGCCAPHPKEEPTLPTTDGTYIKLICPSGGHGRGQRLALKPRCGSTRNDR